MKIKLSQYILAVLLLVGLHSCTKETPVDNVGSVQFVFNGMIDGNVVNYEAGKNGYIMNTNYTDLGANDIALMSGEFINKDDSTQDILRFDFYGYDEQDNSNMLKNAFSARNIVSTSTDSTTVTNGNYEFQFDALNNTLMNHYWSFGDGATATGASVTHSYPPSSQVNVTLTTTILPTNCTDSVTNSIDLSDLACQIQFETLPTSVDSYNFEAPLGYSNYTWLINNVNQMINNPIIQQSFKNPVRQVVELIGTQGNCTSSWKAVVLPDTLSTNGCFAGFKFTTLQQPTTSFGPRSKIRSGIITYITNGKTFRSQKVGDDDQSNRVVFALAAASAYDNNPAGQKTIRLKGSTNTVLYNISNPSDSIQIDATNINIAVAHP